MKYSMRVQIFFDRMRRSVKKMKDYSLGQTLALIRKEARESMRMRRKASPRGTPPSAHTRAGLREINFHVASENAGYVGPRKFRRRNRLNKPVPAVHEFGGMVLASGNRGRPSHVRRYPERSFMWAAVKRLKGKGKLASKFKFSLRSS